MRHVLIDSAEGWKYRPFAENCITKLKKLGLAYASQQYEVEGMLIKVRIEPAHEYIWISEVPERFTLGCFGPNPDVLPLGSEFIAEFFSVRVGVPKLKVVKVAEYKHGTFSGAVVYKGKAIPILVSSESSPQTYTLQYSAYIALPLPSDKATEGAYTQSAANVVEDYKIEGTSFSTRRTITFTPEDHIRYPTPARVATQVLVNTTAGTVRNHLSYSYKLGFVMRDVTWNNRTHGWSEFPYFSPTSSFPSLVPMATAISHFGRYDTPVSAAGYNEASGGPVFSSNPTTWKSAKTTKTPPATIPTGSEQVVDPIRFTGRLVGSIVTGSEPFIVGKFALPPSGKEAHTVFAKVAFTLCDDVDTPNVLFNQRELGTGDLTGVNVMMPIDEDFNTFSLSPASSLAVRSSRMNFIHIGKQHALFEWYGEAAAPKIGVLKHGSQTFSAVLLANNVTHVPRRSLNPLQTALNSQIAYVVAPDFYDVRHL